MVENISTEVFRCEPCNKRYKDKSGLWYHNKKYHNETYTSCIHSVYTGIHNGIHDVYNMTDDKLINISYI